MTGILKRYVSPKGFGFIAPLDRKGKYEPEIFFHIKSVTNATNLPIGCELRFDVVRSDKGPEAVNVELLGLGGKRLDHATWAPTDSRYQQPKKENSK